MHEPQFDIAVSAIAPRAPHCIHRHYVCLRQRMSDGLSSSLGIRVAAVRFLLHQNSLTGSGALSGQRYGTPRVLGPFKPTPLDRVLLYLARLLFGFVLWTAVCPWCLTVNMCMRHDMLAGTDDSRLVTLRS